MTIPPAKVVKTERTHEENQERAYIAASRRSDRSLEARVESARRASEIHKRRTGRSLRVTEQDVVNEEMYEEEDDDLPMQYRKLTAHLQTGSSEFNRRLQEYLTTQVAMRTAYAEHCGYSQNPSFVNNQANMYPLPNQIQMQQSQQPINPALYRHAPYPQRQNQSMPMLEPGVSSQDYSNSRAQPNNERSASLPTTISPNETGNPLQPIQSRPSFAEGSFNSLMFSNPFPQYNMDNTGFVNKNYSQMSMQLPRESQMFLGNTLNSNDFPTSLLMAGSDPSQLFDWSAAPLSETTQIGKHQSYPTTQGLNSTLSGDQSQDVKKENQDEDQPLNATQTFYEDALKQENKNIPVATTPGLNSDIWDSWLNDTYSDDGIEESSQLPYT